MLGILEANLKHIIGHIYLGPKFYKLVYWNLCSPEMLTIKKRIMKYSPQTVPGCTSLGDGSRAMDHESRDLVMPDLRRCGGGSDGRI